MIFGEISLQTGPQKWAAGVIQGGNGIIWTKTGVWGPGPTHPCFLQDSSLWLFSPRATQVTFRLGPNGSQGLAGWRAWAGPLAPIAPLPACWLRTQITTSPSSRSYAGYLRSAIVSLFAEGSSWRKLTCRSPGAGSFCTNPHRECLGRGRQGYAADNTTGGDHRQASVQSGGQAEPVRSQAACRGTRELDAGQGP